MAPPSAFVASSRDELGRLERKLDAALEKLDATLVALEPLRKTMSLPMRVLVANVFLLSVLAYPCRHFFMPERLVKEVRAKILLWISRIQFAKLGFFAHTLAHIDMAKGREAASAYNPISRDDA